MKLLLGGAQLGSNYGINNDEKYSYNESIKLLEKILLNNDIFGIDTARAYGLSEKVIGSTLKNNKNFKDIKVFSKLNPLAESNSRKRSMLSAAKESFKNSLFELKTRKIYSLSFHRFDDWKKENSDIKELLLKLKNEEKIEKVGISISNPNELLQIIQPDYIDIVQIPYNFLDYRWDNIITLNAESSNPKEIYARSIFLQGMIFSDLKTLRKVTNLSDPKKFIEKIENIKSVLKINNLEELAIRYVKSNEYINGMVLGVDNENQFNKNMLFFNKDKLSLEELDYVNKHRPFVEAKTLNPAKWDE